MSKGEEDKQETASKTSKADAKASSRQEANTGIVANNVEQAEKDTSTIQGDKPTEATKADKPVATAKDSETTEATKADEPVETTKEASEGSKISDAVETSTEPQKTLTTIRLNGGALKTNLEFLSPKQTHPQFAVGDTIRVHFLIREGSKERIQIYEGTVIAIRGEGMGRSFVLRRVTHEVGVERIFPYYSPAIQKIEVKRKGKVHRARLYYLRGKSGKEGRIKSRSYKTGS